MTHAKPTPGSELPARHLADAKLSEPVERGGCPICTERADAEASLLEALLAGKPVTG